MRIILFLVLALLCLTFIKKHQNWPEAALSRPALVNGEVQTLLVCTRIQCLPEKALLQARKGVFSYLDLTERLQTQLIK